MHPPKVAITHPQLAFGGSEIGALRAVEALKGDFAVTLITGGPVDLNRLNRYYGTNLQADDFSIRTVPMPFGMHRTAKFAGLRGAFYQRCLKRIAPEFDVMISAYNVCDFGVPGIQFIADFSFMREWRDRLHPSLAGYRKWWYGKSPLRRAYLGLCDAVAGQQSDGWRKNATIAKCKWAAGILRREFAVEPRVIYPPVAADSLPRPWEKRENGFVCIGRVVPEKRMDSVIAILEKVRQRGHEVHLHILGSLDDLPFGRILKDLAAARSWVSLEGRTFLEKKTALISEHRFGINGCVVDNMPNAVAEMVRAGCITFVPNAGGQTEIVDHPALTFASDDEAVEKINAVLSSAALRENLRQHLSEQASRFSVENFQKALRSVVHEFLEARQELVRTPTSAKEVSFA